MTELLDVTGLPDVVGLTGSRRGPNELQRLNLAQLLGLLRIRELHHGDCGGVDAEGHALARQLSWDVRIVGHPPEINALRAYCTCDELRDPRPYLDRNRDVVDESGLLIAVPNTLSEAGAPRSGTWATVRYAARRRTPTCVLLPDGHVDVRV